MFEFLSFLERFESRMSKRHRVVVQKPVHDHRKSWLTKDEVSRTLTTLNTPFSLRDSNIGVDAAWRLEDDVALPPLPNWGVLVHDEIYKREQDQNEKILKKYYGFVALKDEKQTSKIVGPTKTVSPRISPKVSPRSSPQRSPQELTIE